MAKKPTLASTVKGLAAISVFTNSAHSRLDRLNELVQKEAATRIENDGAIEDKVVGLIYDFAKQFHKNDKAAMEEIAAERIERLGGDELSSAFIQGAHEKIDQHIRETRRNEYTLLGRFRWLLTGK